MYVYFAFRENFFFFRVADSRTWCSLFERHPRHPSPTAPPRVWAAIIVWIVVQIGFSFALLVWLDVLTILTLTYISILFSVSPGLASFHFPTLFPFFFIPISLTIIEPTPSNSNSPSPPIPYYHFLCLVASRPSSPIILVSSRLLPLSFVTFTVPIETGPDAGDLSQLS